MPKVSPSQGNFSTGEISPLFYGRWDADRYKSAMSVCLNYVPTLQGGLVRRPATEYIHGVKTNSSRTVLIPFKYSTTQAYMLEFGDVYVRFYKDGGIIESSPGVPYEIVSPYAVSILPELSFTQSADTLYIAHATVQPLALRRFADASWAFGPIDLNTSQNYTGSVAAGSFGSGGTGTYITKSTLDGPYLPFIKKNPAFTITPSAATGSTITVTAGPQGTTSSVTNSGGFCNILFTASHSFLVGDSVFVEATIGLTASIIGTYTVTSIPAADRIIINKAWPGGIYASGGDTRPALFSNVSYGAALRLKTGSVWGYGEVVGLTAVAADSSKRVVDVYQTFTSTAAKTEWRFGLFQAFNYPSVVTFHEDRLLFLGTPSTPQRVDGSKSGDYSLFSPTDLDSTVVASDGVSFTLSSDDVNYPYWAISDEKGLVTGTAASEWVIKSASANEAISPTSITAKQATYHGSSQIRPAKASKASIYIQGDGRKVREIAYYYDMDGFRSTDVSLLSAHITQSGIAQLTFQKSPHSLVWCARNDGLLACLTYDRDIDGLRAGWSRHQLGGTGNSAGENAVVESVATIPTTDGTSDETWLIVKRYINGSTVRYVERMTPFFDDETEPKDALFLDCSLSYDTPKTVTAVTKANPAVVTSALHGFSNGDRVRFYDMEGMTELDGNVYTVANVAANTFELSGTNSTSYGTFISGTCRKFVTTITGLTHLEGQTVQILADGAVQSDQTVSGGSITLDTSACVVHVGYHYNSDGQLPRINAGSADGASIGKTRRVHRVGVLFHRSSNLLLGQNFEDMTRIIFRSASDAMDEATPLFSGIKSEEFEADYDFENLISWRQDQPLPSTVLAILPQMVTQDR